MFVYLRGRARIGGHRSGGRQGARDYVARMVCVWVVFLLGRHDFLGMRCWGLAPNEGAVQNFFLE